VTEGYHSKSGDHFGTTMNVGAKLSKYVSRNFNCNCKKIDVFDVILFQIYYGAYVPIIIRIKKDLTKLLQK